jgi:hypothetical protein
MEVGQHGNLLTSNTKKIKNIDCKIKEIKIRIVIWKKFRLQLINIYLRDATFL